MIRPPRYSIMGAALFIAALLWICPIWAGLPAPPGEMKLQEMSIDAATDVLYDYVAQCETGGEVDPFIRTEVRSSGSTAYGPVQLTQTLAYDYMTRWAKIFDDDELAYLRRFVNQGSLFLRHGNNAAIFAGYDPRYDYGGSGHLNGIADRRLYETTAKKILGHTYRIRANRQVAAFLRLWRGNSLAAANSAYRFGSQHRG